MTKNEFFEKLASHGLAAHQAQFEPLVKDTIHLHLKPLETVTSIGLSRLGGTPDLPMGMAWPTDNEGNHLSFIGQLDLAAVKPFDPYDVLPSKGYLFFFYDATQEAWGVVPEEKDKAKVIYFDGAVTDMGPTEFPEAMDSLVHFTPCLLTPEVQASIPVINGPDFSFLTKEEKSVIRENIWNMYETRNKLLGFADGTQAGTMEIHGEAAIRGISEVDYEDEVVKKGAADWVLLLQVDSNEGETGMLWGDAGRLSFWVRKEEMKRGDFENVWFQLSSF